MEGADEVARRGLSGADLTRAVGDASFAETLVAALARGLAASAVPDRDPFAVVTAAVEAITLDVATNRTVGLLEALIRDDAELTDMDVTTCLEFVYSHMVSKFQGFLAECFAMPVCADIMAAWKESGRLPASAHIVWGTDLRQRREAGGGWFQGADGLFAAHKPDPQGPSLEVFGVIEVKSRRRRAIAQARRHLARLAHGLRIDGTEWPAPHQGADPVRVVLVTPDGRTPAPEPSWHGRLCAVTLPLTRERLAAAAYAMTIWFVERLGARVFATSPSPWPAMTAEEAGVNAVKQALYYTLLRPLSSRAERIATRLYNVYGFGYDAAADHAAMMWSIRGDLVSDSRPPAPAPREPGLEDLVDRAWAHYRRAELDEALRDVGLATALRPDAGIARRLQWLRAMIHYFRAEFEEAVRAFPAATSETRDVAWAKDRLTVARAMIRLGCLDEARQEVDAVATAGLPARLVPIGVAVCEGLILLRRRAIAEGRERLLAARALLEREAEEIRARATARLGLHRAWALDPSSLATLAIDMLPGFVALGDFRAAIDLVDSAEDVFPPYRVLVARDPELEPMRRDREAGQALVAWLRPSASNG